MKYDFSQPRPVHVLGDPISIQENRYENRVRELEAEGMTRSDAQAVADAEVRCSSCDAECCNQELDSWGVCPTCKEKGFGNA